MDLSRIIHAKATDALTRQGAEHPNGGDGCFSLLEAYAELGLEFIFYLLDLFFADPAADRPAKRRG